MKKQSFQLPGLFLKVDLLNDETPLDGLLKSAMILSDTIESIFKNMDTETEKRAPKIANFLKNNPNIV